MVIEKAKAEPAGLERTARHPALAQAEQVASNFFLAEQIRRSTVMRGQSAHCLDVDFLRSCG